MCQIRNIGKIDVNCTNIPAVVKANVGKWYVQSEVLFHQNNKI